MKSIFMLAIVAIAFGVGTRADRPSSFRVNLAPRHPWRPPFGLDRVGQPIAVVVETDTRPGAADYSVEAFAGGKRTDKQQVRFPMQPPYSANVVLDGAVTVDELVLLARSDQAAQPSELARQIVRVPDFEAEAIAQPDTAINPVDLGTILVPAGWLLLGPGQTGTVQVAAISRARGSSAAQAEVWFQSAPTRRTARPFPLRQGEKARVILPLPETPPGSDRELLIVVVEDGAGGELWRKTIPVMLARDPRPRPRFGATYERLRYDAPISVREPKTGKFSSMRYEDGWNPELRDVVVWLPNGGRFVFWRGSSYIPFWAGLHNTGACYEWAEIISQPPGAVDCVEPLMDKELRYGRVEIVESTSARVHVQWTYQSTDFDYKVWGDEAVEDYYFYPDGFGTRVVNLKADLKNDYELNEFIILTPQGAYPFDVLPDDPVDALYFDGRKRSFRFPNPNVGDPKPRLPGEEKGTAIYRLRFARSEKLSAIYFSPNETQSPAIVFAPFFDKGQMVTPCYWGSHWPLARGNSTGQAIDDRIRFTPTHNSVMSWAGQRPAPVATSERVTLDSLGRSRLMSERRWVWLIGMTDAADARVLDWARSFGAPPSLDLKGARVDFAGYAAERRAICLDVSSNDVRVMIKPRPRCVNPVFEVRNAPGSEARIMLAGQTLGGDRYAWDGRTLWLDTTVESPTELRVTFADRAVRAQEKGVRP